jgi:hypothetical protein
LTLSLTAACQDSVTVARGTGNHQELDHQELDIGKGLVANLMNFAGSDCNTLTGGQL